MKSGKTRCLRKMPLVNQDVINKICIQELIDAAIEIIAEYEIVIWLILDDVPQAFQLIFCTETLEHAGEMRIGDGSPSYDPKH